MIKDETLDYLSKMNGGDWSTDEKKIKLYELVQKCSVEFDGQTLTSLEIGVFGGVSLFCLAHAHKDLKNGFAVGLDSWDNVTPLEGSNHPDNNAWWKSLDIKSVFNAFVKDSKRPEWSGRVNYLKGRSDSFADKFADDSLTLIHQDGNHNVETITKELELWSPKLKIGGYWVADDTNWPETLEGYAKLPSFGFELVEDFTTWQIWKKVGSKKEDFISTETTKLEPVFKNNEAEVALQGSPTAQYVNNVSTTAPCNCTGEPQGFAKFVIDNQNKVEQSIQISATPNLAPAKEGAIRLGNLDIKPILIYLPDTEQWLKRWEEGKKHFAEVGIDNIYHLAGFHGEKWGIAGRHIYLADNRPQEQYYIGHGKVAGNLTQYMSFVVMNALDYTHFLSLEDDCRFQEGWKDRLDQALKDVPADFDILFAGSCCAKGLAPVHVKGDVYEFPYRGKDKWNWYPQCSHALIIAKKAIPHLIATNRDVANPSDVSLVMNSFPKMKVYAVLPRVAEQYNTTLPE